MDTKDLPIDICDTGGCQEFQSNCGFGRREFDVFKPFCLALGIFILLVGAECLCVQKFVFKIEQAPVAVQSDESSDSKKSDNPQKPFEFTPSKPVAWSLIAIGGFLTLNTLLKK